MIISLMKSLFIQGRSLFLQAGNITKIERFFGVFMRSLFIQGKSVFRKLTVGWTEIQANLSKNKKFFYKEKVILLKLSDS